MGRIVTKFFPVDLSMMLTCKMNIAEGVWGVCGTVSSILSGLETRSLGLNTLRTM